MDDLVERNGLYYKQFTDVPFTGKVTRPSLVSRTYRNNVQGSYQNGKADGAWVRYWDNGGYMYKRNYKNGKREGASVTYFENGQLNHKGNWKNGKQEGASVLYNKDGTVNKEYTGTFKNGVKISD